jgi:hypothetical protein
MRATGPDTQRARRSLCVRSCRHASGVTVTMPDETHDWAADWDAARERMRKAADEGFPESWQPESPDDEIVGTLARVTMQAPTSFGPAPVVELVLPGGARCSVWLFHTVLRRAFEREAPALGERLLIRWLGKRRPDGGGNAYDDYRLIVDRPENKGAPDWAAMAQHYDDVQNDVARGRGEPDTAPDAASDDDTPF